MDDCTRRTLLHGAATFGLLSVIAPAEAVDKKGQRADAEADEKARVMSLGMTQGEADCWMLTAQAAGAFFALPELHPMDRQEVATAIHVLQNKLLGRPVYRNYLEKAKEGK
jgi:hypothetical protein